MRPEKTTTKARSGWLLLVLVGACVAVGCQSSPPVQEMSDARQAIAVARDAGAERNAADVLSEAEALLASARRNLSERMYTQARKDALSAKRRALAALQAAQTTSPLQR